MIMAIGDLQPVGSLHDLSPSRRLWRFLTDAMNLIDLIAVLPFWIEQATKGGGGGFAFLRVLRLARVFRVFKMGKYNQGMQMFARVIVASMPAMYILAFFSVLGMVVFGALVYNASRASGGATGGPSRTTRSRPPRPLPFSPFPFPLSLRRVAGPAGRLRPARGDGLGGRGGVLLDGRAPPRHADLVPRRLLPARRHARRLEGAHAVRVDPRVVLVGARDRHDGRLRRLLPDSAYGKARERERERFPLRHRERRTFPALTTPPPPTSGGYGKSSSAPCA